MLARTALLLVASALFSTSNAADFVVQVGQGGLKFAPDRVAGAVVGDTVTFQFLPGSHTATQSTLQSPCSPFAGGFDSGRRTGSTSVDAANTYQVAVNSTDPIWVYCATGSHCSAGMIFAVNAADADFATFTQNAVSPGSPAPSGTTGGVATSRSSSAVSSTSSVCTGGGGGYGSGSSCSSAFSAAKVVPAVLMTVLGASFAGLAM